MRAVCWLRTFFYIHTCIYKYKYVLYLLKVGVTYKNIVDDVHRFRFRSIHQQKQHAIV